MFSSLRSKLAGRIIDFSESSEILIAYGGGPYVSSESSNEDSTSFTEDDYFGSSSSGESEVFDILEI